MAIRPVRLAVTVTRECRSESVYLDGRILVGVKVPGASTKSHDSPTAANQDAGRSLCSSICWRNADCAETENRLEQSEQIRSTGQDSRSDQVSLESQ